MTAAETPSAAPPPSRFQFTLRTLLLLFVVLGSSMAVFGTPGIVVFLVVVGVAVYLHKFWSFRALAYVALAVLCTMWVLGQFPVGDGSARRVSCLGKLRQLGMALQNYRAANGRFPPACTVDKNGRPLHSWRALLLPYLDFNVKSLNLAQPWNSPANTNLIANHINVFACPSDPTSDAPESLQTNYFAVVGPNTAWDPSRPLAASGKEAATTIVLVEVANSGVAWAEPKDVSVDSLGAIGQDPSALVPSSHHGQHDADFFFIDEPRKDLMVEMADGTEQWIQLGGLSPAQVQRLFEIGGCTEEALAAATEAPATRRPRWPNIVALAVWLVSVAALLVGAVRGRKRAAPERPAAVAS